ncbi:MAG TPA: MdtA/MuxA family multidrug efflux RND transporter periplasmic adaptor subunit [Vicinamibacteria bacterium]|nr:MdtA/MuxA family multidrug efflux RND transporter periplasmic adaptor subunit [Vicinamibacteria bacterium]
MNDAGESARADTVAVSPAATKPRRRIGLAVIGGALLLGLLWLGLRGADPGKAGASKGPGPAVPVIVASAERRDVPVYLAGLGTITAFNTVTVRTRVDGQIVQVAFREGQEVHKGDLLVVIDPRPFEVQLSQAQASLARDQAQLADARLNLERDRDLLAQGILPQQQMDSQRALVQQLEASGQVDQSQIDNARLQLTYCRITAPVGGRVGLRLVDEGNVVRAADPNGLLVITQLEPITVLFTLPEDNLPDVARHMKAASLPVDAYSRDDQTKLASGSLLTIDNQIDSSTGTGRLKAVFENRDRALWPNQFVNVRLLLEVKKAQIVVPAAAVQRGSQGVFAYVVKPDKTIEVRLLKVGLTQGGMAAIDDGLAPGDQVVTDGHEKVQAGSRVEPRAGGGKPAAAS